MGCDNAAFFLFKNFGVIMVDTAAQIWRDYVTDGVPASGAKKPEKAKIREWGKWVEGAAGYNTVALLLADTTLTYSTIDAGDYINVRDGGYVYKVAAAGASDHHLTTGAGGVVKLYVVFGLAQSPIAFGAKGDASTDDAAILTAMFGALPVGATVDLGWKIYRTTSPVTISKSVTIKNGAILADHTGLTFDVHKSAKLYVDGVRFLSIGLKSTRVAGHIAIKQAGTGIADRAAGIFTSNCEFDGYGQGAIFQWFGSGASVDRCKWSNCAEFGVLFTSSDNVTVEHNHGDMLGAVGYLGNAFNVCGTHISSGYGADANRNTPTAVNPFPRDITIRHNILSGPQIWEAISLSHGVDTADVSNNMVFGARTGIIVYYDGDDHKTGPRNCRIVSNTVSGLKQDGTEAGSLAGLYGIAYGNAISGAGRIADHGNHIAFNTVTDVAIGVFCEDDPNLTLISNIVRQIRLFTAHAAVTPTAYHLKSCGGIALANVSESSLVVNSYGYWTAGDCTGLKIVHPRCFQDAFLTIFLRPQNTSGVVRIEHPVTNAGSTYFQSPTAQPVSYITDAQTIVTVGGSGAVVADIDSPVLVNTEKPILVSLTVSAIATLTFTGLLAGCAVDVFNTTSNAVTINHGGNAVLKGAASMSLGQNAAATFRINAAASTITEINRNV